MLEEPPNERLVETNPHRPEIRTRLADIRVLPCEHVRPAFRDRAPPVVGDRPAIESIADGRDPARNATPSLDTRVVAHAEGKTPHARLTGHRPQHAIVEVVVEELRGTVSEKQGADNAVRIARRLVPTGLQPSPTLSTTYS